MLSDTRVIDLSDERGAMAGSLLAQLGAEVVMVEPPEGAAIRHRPPFVGDEPGIERSLHLLGFGRGKRSVAVDWRTPGGADEFHAMLGGRTPSCSPAAGVNMNGPACLRRPNSWNVTHTSSWPTSRGSA